MPAERLTRIIKAENVVIGPSIIVLAPEPLYLAKVDMPKAIESHPLVRITPRPEIPPYAKRLRSGNGYKGDSNDYTRRYYQDVIEVDWRVKPVNKKFEGIRRLLKISAQKLGLDRIWRFLIPLTSGFS